MPTTIEPFDTRDEAMRVAAHHLTHGRALSSVVTEEGGLFIVTTVLPEPAPDDEPASFAAIAAGAAAGAAGGALIGGVPGATLGAAVGAAGAAMAAKPAASASRVPITADLLRRGMAPKPLGVDPDYDAWATAFDAAFARTGDWTPLGVACVLGIVKKETGHLKRLDEDLFYTTAAQVTKMFGDRAPHPERLLRNPKLLGDTVYADIGGFMGRGLGTIQLTGLTNHQAFADFLQMPLAQARQFMETVPGAALTAPWYVRHFGGQDAANRGEIKFVIGLVAGKQGAKLDLIFDSIGGPERVANFETFRRLLGA